MDNTKEELHATITARAELDRAFARLLVEDAAVVMSRNMLNVLDRHQQDQQQLVAAFEVIVKEAISSALTPLMDELQRIDRRLSDGEQSHADLLERIERIEQRHLKLDDDATRSE